MRCLSTYSGCWWAYGFTLSSLPPQTLPQICESWLKYYPLQVCKPCHYALVEAVEPYKLDSMSMSYLYEVFKHLLRLWMGICLHIHIITTTEAFTDLQELSEILPDASVQTMPLHLVKAVEPLKCIPHPCDTYMRVLNTCSGYWLVYGFTLTPLPP